LDSLLFKEQRRDVRGYSPVPFERDGVDLGLRNVQPDLMHVTGELVAFIIA